MQKQPQVVREDTILSNCSAETGARSSVCTRKGPELCRVSTAQPRMQCIHPYQCIYANVRTQVFIHANRLDVNRPGCRTMPNNSKEINPRPDVRSSPNSYHMTQKYLRF